jgi:hypothetical protein
MTSGSEQERDAALDKVLRRDWIWRAQITAFIEGLPQGWVGTGEDVRLAATEAGIPAPHHPNAWGAAIMYAVKNKRWLMWTGKVVPMRQKSSHARLTRQYARWDPID